MLQTAAQPGSRKHEAREQADDSGQRGRRITEAEKVSQCRTACGGGQRQAIDQASGAQRGAWRERQLDRIAGADFDAGRDTRLDASVTRTAQTGTTALPGRTARADRGHIDFDERSRTIGARFERNDGALLRLHIESLRQGP